MRRVPCPHAVPRTGLCSGVGLALTQRRALSMSIAVANAARSKPDGYSDPSRPRFDPASATGADADADAVHRDELAKLGWPRVSLTKRMIEWVKGRARELSAGERVIIRADLNQGALHKTEGWQPKVQPLPDDHPEGAVRASRKEKEEAGGAGETRKRKCAVVLGYAGTGYHGLQVNNGVDTIEGDVFAALAAAGAVSKSNAVNPAKVSMRRSARTDAGVHAATNVLSIKLELPASVIEATEIEKAYYLTTAPTKSATHAKVKSRAQTSKPPRPLVAATHEDVEKAKFVAQQDVHELRSRINQYLPPEIRVFGVVRQPRGFQARTFASSRRYEYILPTFLFQPPNPHTPMYARFKEFWDEEARRGTKAEDVGSDWARSVSMPHWMQPMFQHESPLPSWDYLLNHPSWAGLGSKPPAPTTPPVPEDYRATHQITVRQRQRQARSAKAGVKIALSPEQEAQEEELIQRHWFRRWDETRQHTPDEQVYWADVYARMKAFRLPAWQLERARTNFGMMISKHNFHNFTVRRRASDPATWRYMKELSISEPFIGADGIEYVSFRLHGVSFMLHQIRKMIAAVVLTTRGRTPLKLWYHLFQSNRLLVPIAPAAGLFLEAPVFEYYHRDLAKRRAEFQLPFFPEVQPDDLTEVTAFKHAHIYPHIFSAERDHREFSNWIKFIDHHWTPLFGYLNPWGDVPASALLPELRGKRSMPMSTHPKTLGRRLAGAQRQFSEQDRAADADADADADEDEDAEIDGHDENVESDIENAEVNGLQEEAHVHVQARESPQAQAQAQAKGPDSAHAPPHPPAQQAAGSE